MWPFFKAIFLKMQISQSGVFKKPDVGDDVLRKRAAPLRHESGGKSDWRNYSDRGESQKRHSLPKCSQNLHCLSWQQTFSQSWVGLQCMDKLRLFTSKEVLTPADTRAGFPCCCRSFQSIMVTDWWEPQGLRGEKLCATGSEHTHFYPHTRVLAPQERLRCFTK